MGSEVGFVVGTVVGSGVGIDDVVGSGEIVGNGSTEIMYLTFASLVWRIDGVNEIFLPGDPEQRTLAKRSAEGIPLDDGNWNALLKLAEELGVSPPAV